MRSTRHFSHVTTEVDCLSDIKVTSEEEMKDGKYTGITELTYEYIGNNASKINGKSVHVYGSVVYYNVDDYIVDFFNIRETIKISGENNKTTGCLKGIVYEIICIKN